MRQKRLAIGENEGRRMADMLYLRRLVYNLEAIRKASNRLRLVEPRRVMMGAEDTSSGFQL
jgi:hypothetical protein